MPSKTSVAGKAGMAEYRAYTIGIDGHIVGFEALVCADDVEAINEANYKSAPAALWSLYLSSSGWTQIYGVISRASVSLTMCTD
jgi:hypothetical protein